MHHVDEQYLKLWDEDPLLNRLRFVTGKMVWEGDRAVQYGKSSRVGFPMIPPNEFVPFRLRNEVFVAHMDAWQHVSDRSALDVPHRPQGIQ